MRQMQRGRKMNLWNQHDEFFSDFLAQHHDLLLYDVFHQIKSSLLYPPNCRCKGDCGCDALRAKIVLSLNLDLYNKAEERQENPDLLHKMKFLFKIPDDHVLRRNHGQSYPLWLIEQEWQAKETSFRIVARLVETLLRLGLTYEVSIFRERRASLNEAIELILGKTPLKTKARKQEKEPYLCGEKGYGIYFNAYKSICHFITAFTFLEENSPLFKLNTPEQIKEFFSLAQWIRQELLYLQTPNVKGKSLFSEETLLPLPSWVTINDIDLALDPFEDKLQEINAQIRKISWG